MVMSMVISTLLVSVGDASGTTIEPEKGNDDGDECSQDEANDKSDLDVGIVGFVTRKLSLVERFLRVWVDIGEVPKWAHDEAVQGRDGTKLSLMTGPGHYLKTLVP